MTHRDPQHSEPTPEPIIDADGTETAGEAVERTMLDMGPWMVSLMVHLGVIVLALFLVWSTMVITVEEPMGPVSLEALRPSEKLPLNPSNVPEISDDKSARNPEPERPVQDQPDFRTLRPEALNVFGPSSPKGIPDFMQGFPTTGDDSMFVDPRGPGPSADRAKRIVFVIDASGSVIDGFDFVINEMRSTIQKMDEDQSFAVVFFQRGFALEAAANGKRGMHPATYERKTAVSNWISASTGHISPSGSSDPRPALKLAFAYKPDLVYILSDNITGSGEYQLDRAALLGEVQSLNASPGGKPRATIHTIQFLYPDPLDTLKTLSGENGGTHRFIRESDLLGRVTRGPGA